MLENIKKLCELKGTTINRIEKECGLSHGAIRKWDEHPPSVWKVKQISDILGVTVDDLLKQE